MYLCIYYNYYSSDFKTNDGDYNRPDVVKAGAGCESGESDSSGMFSKEYEDNAINAQWEMEKNNDPSGQGKVSTLASEQQNIKKYGTPLFVNLKSQSLLL